MGTHLSVHPGLRACVRGITLSWMLIPLSAGATQPQPSSRPASQIELSGQVDLARLVDVTALRLGLNLEYDSAALKGQVTLRLDGAMSDLELWELTNRVLAARGLTTVRQSGNRAYSVVRIADAASVAALALDPAAGDSSGSGPVSDGPQPGFQAVVVRARHRSTKELIEQLGKMPGRAATGGFGVVTALGDSGLIVIADLAPRIEQARRLVELLDSPEASFVTETVAVANLASQQIVSTAAQLNSKREAAGGQRPTGELIPVLDGNGILIVAPRSAVAAWKELIARLDQREPVQTVTYTPGAFSAADIARLAEQTIHAAGSAAAPADDRWRLVTDDLTGSLILTATPTQHAQMQALMARLEDAPATMRRSVRTFTVKNRSIDEVVEVLEGLLQSGLLGSSTGDEGSGVAPGSTMAPTPPADPVFPMPPPPGTAPGTVNASTATSVLQSGQPPARRASQAGAHGEGRPVVLTVDKGTSTIIATGEPRVLDQVQALLKTLDVRQPQVMLDVLLVTLTDGQTVDFGIELEKLAVSGGTLLRLSSLFGLGVRGSGGDRDGPDSAAGLTGVVLNPGDFSVVLRALESLNHGRALSTPRLLVGNNEQATLDSVVQQPFASVNASNTVSTTSFGGTQDAGTVVTIQPQIAEGDHLLLKYSVSLSSFLGSASSPTLPPARQQNRVQSVATIPDGHTVVVGGIEIENTSNSTSQVPVLGNIPILGEAFKSRSKGDSRSRFYVFIRANVLRNQSFEDLKYISESHAVQTQVETGWPDVKPQVIR